MRGTRRDKADFTNVLRKRAGRDPEPVHALETIADGPGWRRQRANPLAARQGLPYQGVPDHFVIDATRTTYLCR